MHLTEIYWKRQLTADESESRSVVCDSLWPHGLDSPWNSPGQNTGVASLSLLQGIFPTQGANPGLLHCRQILYQLSHQRCSRILEWVACSFFSGSSPPRNWTRISCIAGEFFTSWATREAPLNYCTIALISHASKVMFKILQVRLQQYVNHELPGVQARFRKGRGTKDQIANIYWTIEKAREFQKNIYLCFIDCVDHNKLENS